MMFRMMVRLFIRLFIPVLVRSRAHRWLVRHGWVRDSDNLFVVFATYLAFFAIFPCPVMALLEWAFFNRKDGD